MPAAPSINVASRMWCDLLVTELSVRAAQDAVTDRALIYLECGLPLDRMLDALRITEAEWQARLEQRATRRAENRAGVGVDLKCPTP